MIEIVKDIDLINHVSEYDYTIVPLNCYCKCPDGFAGKVRRFYPYVTEHDKRTGYADRKKLGGVLEARYMNEPKFLIAYVTFGLNFRPDIKSDFLDYDALTTVMKKINIVFKRKRIAAPYIGCNKFDGNGNRERVMEILQKTVKSYDLFVYDYFQRKNVEEEMEWFKLTRFMKETQRLTYKALIDADNERKAKEKERTDSIKAYFENNDINLNIL